MGTKNCEEKVRKGAGENGVPIKKQPVVGYTERSSKNRGYKKVAKRKLRKPNGKSEHYENDRGCPAFGNNKRLGEGGGKVACLTRQREVILKSPIGDYLACRP